MKLYQIPNNAMTLQEPRNGQVAAILHTEIPENAEKHLKNSENSKLLQTNQINPKKIQDVPEMSQNSRKPRKCDICFMEILEGSREVRKLQKRPDQLSIIAKLQIIL